MEKSEFENMWKVLTTALQNFDESLLFAKSMSFMKTAPVDDLTGHDDDGSCKELIESPQVKANALISKHRYKDAVMVHAEATQLPNLAKTMLAMLCANQSKCHLQCSHPEQALSKMPCIPSKSDRIGICRTCRSVMRAWPSTIP